MILPLLGLSVNQDSSKLLTTLDDIFGEVGSVIIIIIITSCWQAATTICPCPSPPSVGAEAPHAAEPTAASADSNVSVGSHGEYFPMLTAEAV